ncbi:MAG: QueG-associated DUF1730 domain-containing protein [Tidjanibacter sp.]|nr:QueG-associated DUF1730 domain-containing protein [Tidjanibacter sp.]
MAAAGFDRCGVVEAKTFYNAKQKFQEWLDQGYAEANDYLKRNIDMRFDQRLILEGARTIIVGAVCYKNDTSMGFGDFDGPKIASFARSRDYHKSLKEMLFGVAAELGLSERNIAFKVTADSAPVAEKTLAKAAGIGWIGRNSLINVPHIGSFVQLGELIVAEECDSYSKPFEGNLCYRCNRCVLRCPTGAIRPEGGIDARLCIANRTIEERTTEGFDTHGWLFGCDECQSCCPYNIDSPMYGNERFTPLFDPRDYTEEFWRTLPDEEFAERFGQTALQRALYQKRKKA